MNVASDSTKSFILGLLSNNGGASSTRFQFLFACILSNLIVFGLWGMLSFTKGTLLEVPETVIWLYAAANGINIAGKVWTKTIESKPTINGEVK